MDEREEKAIRKQVSAAQTNIMIWRISGAVAFYVGAGGALVTNSEAWGLVAVAGAIIVSAYSFVDRP